MKDDIIRIRCSTEDKELLTKAAELDRRSLSDFIRIAALNAAEKLLEKTE